MRRVAVTITGTVGAALLLVPLSVGALERPAQDSLGVVVRTTGPAAVGAVEHAVRLAGGEVTQALPIVDGFAARLPAGAVAALAGTDGVLAVTRDVTLSVAATTASDNPETLDSVYTREVNAADLAAAGNTGQGVTIALIDTGVTPVPDVAAHLVTGLANPAKQGGPPVDCINFSGDGTCDDTYGHGTFLAGLIVGDGRSSGGTYTGVAPGSRLLSVKISGADGSADVSKVLAAIQWVVSFKDTYGIRVLNLSLGTDATDSYQTDPLNYAVERAWRAGIAVVVAASNRGPQPETISKPGDDPLVITVGASDDRETPGVSDDWLPAFSAHGPTAAGLAKPDVVAPGAHLVSLRSPGSYVEQTVPTQTGPLAGTPYRRGSGTSMATAVVSGVAALVYAAHPGWAGDVQWPDRLKYALTATAHKVAVNDVLAVGAGLVDAAGAAALEPAPRANVAYDSLMADGTGALDTARRDVLVTGGACPPVTGTTLDPQCFVVHGQETAQGANWEAARYTGANWEAATWYRSQWVGANWEGSSWYGANWEGANWEGATWYGSYDSSADYGRPAKGSTWYGAWDQ